MIRYSLRCLNDHGFDSWFRDSGAFDDLAAARQIACPSCGSLAISKALMAPSVVTSRAKAHGNALPAPTASDPVSAAPAPEPVTQPVALIDERGQAMRAAVRELYTRITSASDNVGRAFASEARAIHEGESPARSIYGEATRAEVVALLDDGIPLMPLPVPPDDHH